jgi:hypothetical protein
MKLRQWVLTIPTVLVLSMLMVGTSPAKAPGNGGTPPADDFDDGTPEPPLPPGMSERVFIHLPRTYKPNHLGTCVPTTNSTVNDYGLAGWHIPAGGITWKLNPSTVPASVGVSAALTAMTNAFSTWTGADSQKVFVYGGTTSVTRQRLDYVNAVLWGRVSGNAIAITYIRYYTSTGVVADVDTVFNSRSPWAVFDATNGDQCQSTPDAYDVQDIATHEFGHWVGLDDLYSSVDRDLTMYGYGAGGELKKRTLGLGDINGTNAVAP